MDVISIWFTLVTGTTPAGKFNTLYNAEYSPPSKKKYIYINLKYHNPFDKWTIN